VSETPKLVFDVGMHVGEDAEFYLSRGCRVVGVEANPEVLPLLQKKFCCELKAGRLHIINKAIAREAGTAQLAVVEERLFHSTMCPAFIERSRNLGFKMHFVEVPTIPLEEILNEFGTPYYLKIDIEGMDMACVKALHHVAQRPKYVSFESSVHNAAANFEERFSELAHLWVLGYDHFKYVDQASLCNLENTLLQAEGPPLRYTYRKDSSGPFGEETPGEWCEIGAALSEMRGHIRIQNTIGLGNPYSQRVWSKVGRRVRRVAKHLPSHSWYDLHARLGSSI